MTRKLHILGVDPGHYTGAVLLDFDGVIVGDWAYGSKDHPTDGDDAFNTCLEANRIAEDYGCTVILAVEAQFIPNQSNRGQARRAHAVNALKVAQHAGGWKYAAGMCGWHVWGEDIHPNSWRQEIYGGHQIVKADMYAAWAVSWAERLLGIDTDNEHLAEAGLIALRTIWRIKEYGVL